MSYSTESGIGNSKSNIDELIEDIKFFFGKRVSNILRMYFLKRNFYFFGILFGCIVGFLLRDLGTFIILGTIISLSIYCYTESYLLKIDHEFFSSNGHSKREVFDKYYSKEISRTLSLRMTEPGQLLENNKRTPEEVRSMFQKRLSLKLDEEFERSDWKFFVAEVLVSENF